MGFSLHPARFVPGLRQGSAAVRFRLELECGRQGGLHHIAQVTEVIGEHPLPELQLYGGYQWVFIQQSSSRYFGRIKRRGGCSCSAAAQCLHIHAFVP